MYFCSRRQIPVFLLCFLFVNTEADNDESGSNVLVSFSQNINAKDGVLLIQRIKDSMKEASDILYSAVGRRFSKVRFRIPDSWNTSGWNIAAGDPFGTENDKSDLLIDSTNDVVFGKFPYAQQYASCGVPGHQIIVPTAFFTSGNTFPKGVALAREWLKYRYGVFDENGFEGDPLYPQYYALPGDDPNEVKITQCTNAPVKYSFKDRMKSHCLGDDPPMIDRLDSKECRITPDEESLENVTSSLMYFQQDITQMKHVCGKDPDHEHNALSPNKHNAMCRGKSIWSIVEKSANFRDETETSGEIEFIYLQDMKPKIVVAWENTNKMKTKGDIILNSIRRLIYDLPSGSKFNGFPFTTILSEEKDYELKVLNELKDKNDIMINIKSDFVKNEEGNINRALSRALDILASDTDDSVPRGTVIILSSTVGTSDGELLDRLQKSKVCVRLLFLGEGSSVTGELDKYVSASNCGSQESIPTSYNEEVTFNSLFAAMETAVLPVTIEDKITETEKTGYLTNVTAISFDVDDSVETITFWVFSAKESENFELKFNERSEKLSVIHTTGIMSLAFSPREAGSVVFAYPHITDPIFTQVRTTSKAGKYFRGEIFTEDTSANAGSSSSDQMPVILYAMVRYGVYPVQNAKVTATIERPNADRVELEMFDDGKGDPDITQNDGVYSRYFTQFSEKGEYTVTVTVEGNGDLTTYGIDGNAGYQTCCGSTVKTSSSKISISRRTFQTTFRARNGRPDGGYKPSRILDLRIENSTDDKIVLTWSAPGGEGDSGSVQSYEIKRYRFYQDAVEEKNGTPLSFTSTPAERGSTESLELSLRDFEEVGFYYLTIKAKRAQKTSDASRILEIFIPDKETTPTPDTDSDEKDKNQTGGSDKKTALIIGLVVGVIVLVILIFVVVYFLVIRPRRKQEMKENPIYQAPKKSENNVLNPINFIPADTLLKHHNEKMQARRENKEPPIFKEEDFEGRDSPPTPESPDNNNRQQPEHGDKKKNNEESLPPKSPKKTTYV